MNTLIKMYNSVIPRVTIKKIQMHNYDEIHYPLEGKMCQIEF